MPYMGAKKITGAGESLWIRSTRPGWLRGFLIRDDSSPALSNLMYECSSRVSERMDTPWVRMSDFTKT
jgi:hypothetical protein